MSTYNFVGLLRNIKKVATDSELQGLRYESQYFQQ